MEDTSFEQFAEDLFSRFKASPPQSFEDIAQILTEVTLVKDGQLVPLSARHQAVFVSMLKKMFEDPYFTKPGTVMELDLDNENFHRLLLVEIGLSYAFIFMKPADPQGPVRAFTR